MARRARIKPVRGVACCSRWELDEEKHGWLHEPTEHGRQAPGQLRRSCLCLVARTVVTLPGPAGREPWKAGRAALR